VNRTDVVNDGSSDDLEQQRAINHADGPCLVLAAPGSGKTHVITKRFVRLVREGLVGAPHEIVAMAYNRAAANVMLERVEDELGPIPGDPPLTTYHSWAFDLVRSHGWRLGWPESFRIPSAGEEALHIRAVLRELTPPTLYSESHPHESIDDVANLIAKAKQELVSPEAYLRFVGQHPTPADTGDQRIYWQRHRDLANVYEALTERYSHLRLVDHDDAISMAARLLDECEDVQNAYANVRFVMVDEFQDTNSAQAKMVEALVRTHRNIMVVADDDQAIYRFRGASRANIQRFRSAFADYVELSLPVNRRSTSHIIEFSAAIVSQSVGREPKEIRAQRERGAIVNVSCGHTRRDEAEGIALNILNLREAGAGWRNIGILVRLREDMTSITQSLRAHDIPFFADQGRSLFRTEEVKLATAMMEAALDPKARQAWLACTNLPAWEISAAGKRAILKALHDSELTMPELLEQGIAGLDQQDSARTQTMVRSIQDLQSMALRADVREVFEEAMVRSQLPMLGDSLELIERAQFASNLSRLYEIIDEYCRFEKTATLPGTLDYLNLVRERGKEREATIEQADGVRISTIHGAKGLEWCHVFVPTVSQGKIPCRERTDRFELPAELAEGELAGAPGDHIEEERRLLYVAVTRAKDTLWLSWAKQYSERGRDEKRSEFLSRVPSGLFRNVELPPATMAFRHSPRGAPSRLETHGVTRLSFSEIEDFRACPKRFEFGRIWHLPPVFSAEAWYGSLLHAVLTRLGQLRIGGQQISIAVVDAVWETEWEASPNRGRVGGLNSEGARMLRNYVASPLWTKTTPLKVEYNFRIPMEHKADWVLSGRIDRIDDDDGTPVVIDYKSGRPGDETAASHSLQLQIYAKTAMELSGLGTVRASLHWLRNSESSTVEINRSDTLRTTTKLENTFERVVQCESRRYYPAKPSPWRCGQCSYRLICTERAESDERIAVSSESVAASSGN
jgi:DNA helicase-2/ATP-dependent DNA helicase PcrA